MSPSIQTPARQWCSSQSLSAQLLLADTFSSLSLRPGHVSPALLTQSRGHDRASFPCQVHCRSFLPISINLPPSRFRACNPPHRLPPLHRQLICLGIASPRVLQSACCLPRGWLCAGHDGRQRSRAASASSTWKTASVSRPAPRQPSISAVRPSLSCRELTPSAGLPLPLIPPLSVPTATPSTCPRSCHGRTRPFPPYHPKTTPSALRRLPNRLTASSTALSAPNYVRRLPLKAEKAVPRALTMSRVRWLRAPPRAELGFCRSLPTPCERGKTPSTPWTQYDPSVPTVRLR